MNHLARLFDLSRRRAGLTLGQVARALGYANICKGARKVDLLESGQSRDLNLAQRVAALLGVSEAALREACALDDEQNRIAFERWASEPVPPQLVVRYLAAVYGLVPIPDGLAGPSELEEFARHYAKQHGYRVCLEFNRRERVWIDQHGRISARSESTPENWIGGPRTTIGGKTVPRQMMPGG